MSIGLPTPEVSWQFALQTRITYTSVVQCCGDIIYNLVQTLKTQGWTVKGSCDGTTGAMDGVDRWAGTPANARVRFNGSAGAQSWFVLTDGDGANLGFSFNGAADDRYNVWWSPTGVAVAAGTANQEPTATDMIRLNAFFTSTPPTIAGSGTSGDRILSIWYTTDHKNFRCMVARSGAWVCGFGKEQYSAAQLGTGITLHPGFAWYLYGAVTNTRSGTNDAAATAALNDQFRTTAYRTDGGGTALAVVRKMPWSGLSSTGTPTYLSSTTVAKALQGGSVYGMKRMSLESITTSHEGDIGKMKDWWIGRSGVGDGDTYGSLQFIVINAVNGFVWPWDGATAVVMT